MTLYRRNALKGIGGVTTSLTLAGCLGGLLGGGDQGTTLWNEFTEGEQETLDKHLETFNEGRDDELQSENLSDLEGQLKTAIPAGNGPHTFPWAHDRIGKYQSQDFLYDAAKDVDLDLEGTFTENAAAAVQWDDGVYGLPYGSETVSLMYNPDLVEEPPETVSEMVDIMDEHHEPENSTWGLSCPPTTGYFVSAFLQAFGGNIYDEENRDVGIESDAFIEGLELLENTVWEYVADDTTYGGQMPPFADGNAPFAINGPWQVSGFRDSGVDATVAPLPEVDGGSLTPYTGVQTWYFTSELDGAEEAAFDTTMEWAEWYATSEDVIMDNATEHGLIPVHQEYTGSDDLGEDVAMFAESVDMGTPMPVDPRVNQAFWTTFESGLEKVFNDQAGAKEAMTSAAEEIRSRWD
ncbi:extracellular solute-binding protein [Natrinema ejinorense]|uniref:Sugar ABC transporter substrate-binding protein n=1 Tax=Natrinema ejinorense TaxID=373386 RepID=A0A2A5QQZ7_9EURY|nr:extracellular solute-binding protein [Natrinema ejinorense]PCR89267.1 sugar ABC transporter substrate-binding protein [Natrinema ejinorense]